MRIIVLALALLPSAAIAQERDAQKPMLLAPVTRDCHNAKNRMVGRLATTLKVQPLSQEPPANLYSAVLRREGGCDVPVLIREDVGNHQH